MSLTKSEPTTASTALPGPVTKSLAKAPKYLPNDGSELIVETSVALGNTLLAKPS